MNYSSCVFLSSQLEEQRMYYERRLAASNDSEHRRLISSLEQEKKSLKRANESLSQKSLKLEEELCFVRYVTTLRCIFLFYEKKLLMYFVEQRIK